jgi:hypothetical protein
VLRRMDLKRIPTGMENLTINVQGLAKGSYLVTRTQNGVAASEIIVIQ